MSSKVAIKWRAPTDELPGFHLYEDVLDSFGPDGGLESPVYLELDGIEATMQTLASGGALVNVVLPRKLARELGLVPTDANLGTASDSTR